MPGLLIIAFFFSASYASVSALPEKWIQFPGVSRPQTAPYRVEQLSQGPRLNRRVDPIIPKLSPPVPANARVAIQVIINEQGEVWGATVLSGDERLESAALEAVRQWRYEPMWMEGMPVPVITTLILNFAQSGTYRGPGLAPLREPIRVGGNVQELKKIYSVEPAYPPEARSARLSGTVILQATINESGDVYEVRVLRGHPLLNRAVAEAVIQWKYSPTLINGERVPVIATITVIFDLQR
jgi:TonB family protein